MYMIIRYFIQSIHLRVCVCVCLRFTHEHVRPFRHQTEPRRDRPAEVVSSSDETHPTERPQELQTEEGRDEEEEEAHKFTDRGQRRSTPATAATAAADGERSGQLDSGVDYVKKIV